MTTLHDLISRPDEKRKFSDVLHQLGHGVNPRLSLREMVEAFGERGFGALLFLLALMALFPWPPGGKAVFSVPIILLSAELALQKTRVWLPRSILDRSVPRDTYRRAMNAPLALPRWLRRRVLPSTKTGLRGWMRKKIAASHRNATTLSIIRATERLTRPRWPLMTGEIADSLTGVACIAMAVMMAFPVPFGDMLPAIALALLGLGVMQRDGLFIMAGAIATVISGAYLLLVWKTVVAIFTGMASWIGSLF